MKGYSLWFNDRPAELLDSHQTFDDNDKKIRVLGKYEEGEVFAGTDRLSMAVQPKVIEYLANNNDDVIIFEGDRLCSAKLFREAANLGYNLFIIHVNVSDEERQRRYELRGSDQDEKFINGRKTKVNNVVEEFGPNPLFGDEGNVLEQAHETPEDTTRIVGIIEKLVGH
jgi:hypothetical protein